MELTEASVPFSLHAKDMVEAWKQVCQYILREGSLAQPILSDDSDSIPSPTREAINVVLTIEDASATPDIMEIMKATHPGDVVDWMAALWDKGAPPEGIDRTYAVRVFDYDDQGLDQVTRISELLSRDPESRRGVITMGDPRRDDPTTPASVPCLSSMHFIVRDELMKTNIYFRSWDAGKKLLPDLVGLADVRDKLSRSTGIPLGALTVFVGSIHIYEDDVGWVTNAVSN